MQNILTRAALITPYKVFARPRLDVTSSVIKHIKICHEKIESIQYNACLASTGAISGTSKLNYELGLESLRPQPWDTKLSTCYKIFKNQSP